MRTREDDRTAQPSARADRRPERAEFLHLLGLVPLPSGLDFEWLLDRFEETGRT